MDMTKQMSHFQLSRIGVSALADPHIAERNVGL